MQLLNQLRCLFRGHALGNIEPDVFWFSATCQCCGKTVTADTAFELLIKRGESGQPESLRSSSTHQKIREVVTAV